MPDDSDDQRPVNPFARAQPVNPFAQPTPVNPLQPASPFAPPAAPVNPFAPAAAPATPSAPAKPFAQPAADPLAHASAPAFAQAPETAPPVNPFARSPMPVADAPYRAPVATPPAQVAPPVVQPLGAVPAITNLRPLTILVGLAAALFAVALMMQLLWMLSLPSTQSITIQQLRDIGAAKKRAETTSIVALLALAATVTPWLYLAGRNARRMCADRPRFAAWVPTVMFPIPAVNLVITGLALNDIWRHSAERLRDRNALITWFTRLMVYGAIARFAVIFLANARHPLVLTNGIVSTTMGESMSLVYVTNHNVLLASIFTTMMMVALPVLGAFAVFAIDRAQREASLRLRAKAI